MSRYDLNRFLFDLKMERSILDEAKKDLGKAIEPYDLSDEEETALIAKDPRRLRALGAHGMLSLYIMQLHPEFEDNIYWTQK